MAGICKSNINIPKRRKNKYDDGPDALTGVAEKCMNNTIDLQNFKFMGGD